MDGDTVDNKENKLKINEDIEVLSFDDDDLDESSVDNLENTINIVDNPEIATASIVSDEVMLTKTRSLEEIIESNKELNSKQEDKSNKKSKFNIQARVIIMSIFIVGFLCGAALLVCEALTSINSGAITYNEKSENTYRVCLNDKKVLSNNDKCLKENERYNEVDVEKIYSTFKYNMKLQNSTDYSVKYHVSSFTKIYNKYDEKLVKYKNEEILLDEEEVYAENNEINIEKEVNIDFSKYNEEVLKQKIDNSDNYEAAVEVILYVDDGKDERRVSSIIIPLNTSVFSIEKYNIHPKKRTVSFGNVEWNNYMIICLSIAAVLIIISIVLIYKMIKLILNNRSRKTIYQQKVLQILREYDRIIVIARDGYESNEKKEVIRVATFDELLDVKDNLNKPIIYSKVNDARSEFIVEGEKRLYKYVMREIDY